VGCIIDVGDIREVDGVVIGKNIYLYADELK
jgi:hypothetical protein